MDIQPGQKIAVYTEQKIELGEGTFRAREWLPDMNTTAYECDEHTILARGAHYVRTGGQWFFVEPRLER